ncbi:hypothetical protein BGZ99_010046 [Dissophora globulifera]|uniref:Uncharacterized protein n=1 Tax=Dissophora globulifera TaxID=979702 RepID=A0A9P6RQ65_9FUNG|nr:hypothetical protein BGZ99_010046 [Dissophora globulifera]
MLVTQQSIRDTAPVQRIRYDLILAAPGLVFNTEEITLSVPVDKICDIRREAFKMAHKSSLTLRKLLSFIDKTNAIKATILPVRLRSQRLLQLRNSPRT